MKTFETERLILRPITKQDFPSYQKNFADYEVIRFLAASVPWPYPENGAEFFIKQMILPHQGIDRWCWGIFEKNNLNEVIGAVDLWRIPNPANRGFWLAHRHWNKGYMTEAVTPVMNYAFSELGFEELFFSNALGNTQSRRIKEKTGAKLTGIRVEVFVDPKFTKAENWHQTKKNWIDFAAKTQMPNE
jgi:RimJ/RimL family protein N-acetyltransferase